MASSNGQYKPGYYNTMKSWSLWGSIHTAVQDAKSLTLDEVISDPDSKTIAFQREKTHLVGRCIPRNFPGMSMAPPRDKVVRRAESWVGAKCAMAHMAGETHRLASLAYDRVSFAIM